MGADGRLWALEQPMDFWLVCYSCGGKIRDGEIPSLRHSECTDVDGQDGEILRVNVEIRNYTDL